MSATMLVHPGRVVAAELTNLSAGGFSAICKDTIPIGAVVILFLNGVGRLKATVRWELCGRIGARFETRLSATELRLLVTHGAS